MRLALLMSQPWKSYWKFRQPWVRLIYVCVCISFLTLFNVIRFNFAISNMNVDKARDEMIEMSEQVWKDAEQWQRGIHNGQAVMKQIKAINLKLFSTENRLNNADSRKELQATGKRINHLYQCLQRPLATIGNILRTLTGIRDNTARMLSRLTIFLDDETLAKHRIRPKLESSKLLKMLQFLSHRYDTEWEVKEMVVSK